MKILFSNRRGIFQPDRQMWEAELHYMLLEFEKQAQDDGYELDWSTLGIAVTANEMDDSTLVEERVVRYPELHMTIEGE